MSMTYGDSSGIQGHIDYDIHGLVGLRLIDPSPSDAAAVARQLGPLQGSLSRPPDIVVRFVKHLPLTRLRYVTLHECGFTDDGFVILRSKKRGAKVQVAFDQFGQETCEIVCESGLRAIPGLLTMLNLTLLKKDCVALHASAFVYQDCGILVTGWAKGGKTESLLAFALHGAQYVGDEWIILTGDGEQMGGIPENMRLWDWHIEYLPHVRRMMKRDERILFAGIHWLDAVQQRLSRGWLRHIPPLTWWREAMPALKRQLNVTVAPQALFGKQFGPLQAKPEKVFLLMNHAEPNIQVEQTDPHDIAQRMAASVQYEQLPLMEQYLAYKFAHPGKYNAFIEQAPVKQGTILARALAGKEAYTVLHPYPVSLHGLFEGMRPFCSTPARVS